MYPFMSFHICPYRKSPAAYVTDVRLLSCVRPHVAFQQTGVLVYLAAYGALEHDGSIWTVSLRRPLDLKENNEEITSCNI